MIVFALLIGAVLSLSAQDDPVLFTVENSEVSVSEFEYIYNKNNAKNADYTEASLREYLDLYIRFKLKVQAAYDQQYDTIPGLKTELAGYRKQLASSYLLDKQLKNQLVTEVYQRKGVDVEVSHILIKLTKNATPQDSAFALQRALKVRKDLLDGQDFSSIAVQFSDDKTKVNNKGYLGYINGTLPDGFYNVETAMHELPIGEISEPVLSVRGYHIMIVHDRREARGEMEIAQILIRKSGKVPGDGPALSEAKMIYQNLKAGENFEEMAKKYSDDDGSASRGGYIGFVGVGLYEKSFEDSVFALKHDGDFTSPVESSLGFHIIKRIGKKERLPYDLERRNIETEIKKSDRLQVAKAALVENILLESGFMLNKDSYNALEARIDTSLFDYTWSPPSLPESILFTLNGNLEYTTQDFFQYLNEKKRERMVLRGNYSVNKGLRYMFNNFKEKACLDFEESRLEEKYPDFKALMREYEEGILLFEITKDNVWDKATLDTTGLKEFFNKHQKNYMWEERLSVAKVHLDSISTTLAKEILEKASTKNIKSLEKKYNKERVIITHELKSVKKGEENKLGLAWKPGTVAHFSYDDISKDASFDRVESIIPPQPKTLSDARGFIIADYQDYLENEWIKELKRKYTVKVNEDVFSTLIGKNQ